MTVSNAQPISEKDKLIEIINSMTMTETINNDVSMMFILIMLRYDRNQVKSGVVNGYEPIRKLLKNPELVSDIIENIKSDESVYHYVSSTYTDYTIKNIFNRAEKRRCKHLVIKLKDVDCCFESLDSNDINELLSEMIDVYENCLELSSLGVFVRTREENIKRWAFLSGILGVILGIAWIFDF